MIAEAVVDTSILAKAVFTETDSDLVERWFARGLVRHAPEYVLTELASIGVKKVRFSGLTMHQADAGLEDGKHLIDLLAPNDHAAAMRIAVATTASFYDSLFVALAESLGLPLVTADVALVKRLKAAGWPGTLVTLDDLRAMP